MTVDAAASPKTDTLAVGVLKKEVFESVVALAIFNSPKNEPTFPKAVASVTFDETILVFAVVVIVVGEVIVVVSGSDGGVKGVAVVVTDNVKKGLMVEGIDDTPVAGTAIVEGEFTEGPTLAKNGSLIGVKETLLDEVAIVFDVGAVGLHILAATEVATDFITSGGFTTLLVGEEIVDTMPIGDVSHLMSETEETATLLFSSAFPEVTSGTFVMVTESFSFDLKLNETN